MDVAWKKIVHHISKQRIHNFVCIYSIFKHSSSINYHTRGTIHRLSLKPLFFFSFKYFFFTINQSPEKEILLKPEVYPKVSLEGRGGGIPRERALNPPAANPRAKGWNCIEAPDDTEEAADVEVGNEAKEAVKRFLV